MKTKFYALFVSAALIAQANAGGHFAAASRGPAPNGVGSSIHSMPMRSSRSGPVMYSSQRFSPAGIRQFNPGNISRFNGLARSGNNPRVRQSGNNFVRRNGTSGNTANDAGQVRRGNNLPSNWQNHVVAQHSANWHRDWNRSRDHVWHGHHCRFINGSWAIFDFGFYPWWGYGYPYDYYSPYDYYTPGYYDPNGYDDDEYYDQKDYSSDQSAGSTVADAQEQLAQQGYYRGEIDGIFGPETRRAIVRYQRNHGLRVTGGLTKDTLQALGLRRFANY